MAKSALGKGLSALISTRPSGIRLEAEPGEKIQQADLASIVPSPLQPRKDFAREALGELVESIRQHGIIQPLVVRNVAGKSHESGRGVLRAQRLEQRPSASQQDRVTLRVVVVFSLCVYLSLANQCLHVTLLLMHFQPSAIDYWAVWWP